MQFLYPLGLLAILGLIVPLIIHLWNVKQGKTLKVGSIILLGESSRASSKSFKINDWLLLVLRCLLLLLIAIVIAQPFLKKAVNEKDIGWILVEKSNFKQVFNDNRKTIDSLTKSGYEIHDFSSGFALLNKKDTANLDSLSRSELNFTSLLNRVNDYVPAGNSVYLFADHRLNKLGSELPKIAYKLIWQSPKQVDTSKSWITEYAGKKYEANSNPSNTLYSVINNELASIKIAVFESGSSDKKYLIAALNAIGSFSGRQIETNPVGNVDVGFWLSNQPVSSSFKSLINPNGTLFQYQNGKVISETSVINIDGRSVSSNKRISAPKSLNNIWTDGYGNSILTAEKQVNLNLLRFYSRFNPQWNQLVWSELFVRAIMPVVVQNKNTDGFGFENNPSDQRRLAYNQKETIQIEKSKSVIKTSQNEPVSNLFWIASFLILLAERILSFRNKTVIYAKN